MILLVLFYLILSLIVTGAVYLLTKNKVRWHRIDPVLIIVIPIVTWFVLTYINLKPKSLSNFLEIPMLAIGTGMISILNLLVKNKTRGERTLFNVIIPILLATCIYFLIPTLPE